MYTDQEVNEIFRLVKEGKTISDAKHYVRGLNKEVLDIADVVKDHFQVETLKPYSRCKEQLAPMAAFLHLVHDLLPNSHLKECYFTALNLTGRDRTTYISYRRKVLDDRHLFDPTHVLGDSNTNHFLKIKEKITGEDLSQHYIKPFIKETPVHINRYKATMNKHISDILIAIEEGEDFRFLNDVFFDYICLSSLRKNMKEKDPDLYAKVNKKKSKYHDVMFKHGEKIIRKAKQGDTFQLVNELYFDYLSVESLRAALRKYDMELYKQFLENESIYSK